MGKVIINKTVAGWIEDRRKLVMSDSSISEYQHNKCVLSQLLGTHHTDDLVEQNIDIVTLAKAIQYGYEVPYEFKVGDLVKNGIGEIIEVVAVQPNSQTRTVEYVNHDKNLFKLVCKAEERHDLK